MNRSEFLKLLGLGAAVVSVGGTSLSAQEPYFDTEKLEKRKKELVEDDWVYGIYDGEDIRFLNDHDMAPVTIVLGKEFLPGDVVRWKRDKNIKQTSQRLFATKLTD